MDTFESSSPDELPQPTGNPRRGETRRQFITQVTAAGAGVVVAPAFLPVTAESAEPSTGRGSAAAERVSVQLKVNGATHTLKLDPRVTLLDVLRERLGLTGSKKGCDHGQCGACTVLVNGRRINSCLSLVAVHDGDDVTTIEGLAQDDKLHRLQELFIKCDGFQCGYCTPGQILSAVALFREGCPKSDEGIRELMSGNLCRCGAYNGIVQAIRETRDQQPA